MKAMPMTVSGGKMIELPRQCRPGPSNDSRGKKQVSRGFPLLLVEPKIKHVEHVEAISWPAAVAIASVCAMLSVLFYGWLK